MAQRTVVVGGGIIGSCVAWFLRELDAGGDVIVLEPDPSYRFATTARSVSAIRTQFTLPLNVRMSLFGAEFLARMAAAAGDRAVTRASRLSRAGDRGRRGGVAGEFRHADRRGGASSPGSARMRWRRGSRG